MKKHFKISKRIIAILLLTIMLFTSNVIYAVWWATPAYEWALTRGITSVKTNKQLTQVVSHTDFYSIITNYLEYKGFVAVPDRWREKIQHSDNMSYLNNVVAGLAQKINAYISKNSLTPDEYRIVESYISHAREMYATYSEYLTRENMKNVDLYFKLAQYRAASIVDDVEYRELALARVGRVKNTEIFNYGIMPYAGDVSRQEFLLLMFDIFSSDETISDDEILRSFYASGVLRGYELDLMLDDPITYSEMLTFLYRFEIYDFNG